MSDVHFVVAFTELTSDWDSLHLRCVGKVDLDAGPVYFIELSARFLDDPVSTAAVLSHEVMHVFLHRHAIRLENTLLNEILTDTAAGYLGTGWLMLNAHRASTDAATGPTMAHRLGYVSPEEQGYILAKRAPVGNGEVRR